MDFAIIASIHLLHWTKRGLNEVPEAMHYLQSGHVRGKLVVSV
jgi:NADPH-dependent curcumin reductase CurA